MSRIRKKKADEVSAIDEFVPKLVALIKSSHAYKDGGMIVVTFDEAEVPKTPQTVQFLPDDEEHDEDPNPAPDWANSCCDEKPGPMWKDPGLRGPGGGKVGAIVISPFIKESTPDDKHANTRTTTILSSEPLKTYLMSTREVQGVLSTSGMLARTSLTRFKPAMCSIRYRKVRTRRHPLNSTATWNSRLIQLG